MIPDLSHMHVWGVMPFMLLTPAGSMLGFLFAIITLKLSLGTAGIIPSLNIPAGLISFALLKSWTSISSSIGLSEKSPWLHKLLFKPFLLQENSILQVQYQLKLPSPWCLTQSTPLRNPGTLTANCNRACSIANTNTNIAGT